MWFKTFWGTILEGHNREGFVLTIESGFENVIGDMARAASSALSEYLDQDYLSKMLGETLVLSFEDIKMTKFAPMNISRVFVWIRWAKSDISSKIEI